MVYDLFLDDERFPPRPTHSGSIIRDWHIARSYEEAVLLVQEWGLPRFISFDHDLGYKKKTGYDFAKWLIDWCMDNGWPGFDCAVHSMNPVGKRNIEMLIGNYIMQDRPGEGKVDEV